MQFTGSVQYVAERWFKRAWWALFKDRFKVFWQRRREMFDEYKEAVDPSLDETDSEDESENDTLSASSSGEDDESKADELDPNPDDTPEQAAAKEKARKARWLDRQLHWEPDRDEDRLVYGLPPRAQAEEDQRHRENCKRRPNRHHHRHRRQQHDEMSFAGTGTEIGSRGVFDFPLSRPHRSHRRKAVKLTQSRHGYDSGRGDARSETPLLLEDELRGTPEDEVRGVGMRHRRTPGLTPNPFPRVSGHYDDRRVLSADAELDNAMFGTDPNSSRSQRPLPQRASTSQQRGDFPETQRVMSSMMKRMGH